MQFWFFCNNEGVSSTSGMSGNVLPTSQQLKDCIDVSCDTVLICWTGIPACVLHQLTGQRKRWALCLQSIASNRCKLFSLSSVLANVWFQSNHRYFICSRFPWKIFNGLHFLIDRYGTNHCSLSLGIQIPNPWIQATCLSPLLALYNFRLSTFDWHRNTSDQHH